MLPLVIAGCASRPPVIKAKPVPPPAWMMQPAPDWKTPLSGIIFTLTERVTTMQAQLEGLQDYVRTQCR
nr:lysis system i-spanin subunit Rz [Photorhabdus heterorhabditis]